MTDEIPSGKPKELSQAHARGHARELLESIGGGGQWDAALERFEGLSAGNRKLVLEALQTDRTSVPARGEPSRVLQLGLASLKFGKSPKPDFVLNVVQTVIETCYRFDTGQRSVAGEVLGVLLAASDRENGKSVVDISPLDLARLGRSRAVGEALSSFLAEPGNDSIIRKTIHVWSRLLCAQLASQGLSCGIAPESAQRVLLTMSDPALPLPPELVLSVSWLGRIAGGVPRELRARAAIAALLDAEASSEGRGTDGTTSDRALKGPREVLLAAIEQAIFRFEEDGDQRRSALSAALAQASDELAASRAELAEEQARTRSLMSKIDELTATMHQRAAELASAVTEMDHLRNEMGNWRKEAEVLLESRAHQVDDAKFETRKEFVSSARTHLLSLRGFLLELKKGDTSDVVSLCATAFDQVIRVLHRQGYLAPEELPRLNERDIGNAK